MSNYLIDSLRSLQVLRGILLVVFFCFLGSVCLAQDPSQPDTVYYMPGGAASPNGDTLYIPPGPGPFDVRINCMIWTDNDVLGVIWPQKDFCYDAVTYPTFLDPSKNTDAMLFTGTLLDNPAFSKSLNLAGTVTPTPPHFSLGAVNYTGEMFHEVRGVLAHLTFTVTGGGCICLDTVFTYYPPPTGVSLLLVDTLANGYVPIVKPQCFQIAVCTPPVFIAHSMTPEGEPYPFDVIISDGEWVQKFDSVTYIATEVPEVATYTYTYTYVYDYYNHREMGQTEFNFAPGEIREFEFYAIDPAQIEECSRPYIAFREYGASDSLAWQWYPGENKLCWTLFKEPEQNTGLKIWSDADSLVPVDKYVLEAPSGGIFHKTRDEIDLYLVKIEYTTLDIDLTFPGTTAKQRQLVAQSWISMSDSVIFADNDPNNGTLGIRDVSYNCVSIDSFSTTLYRSNGTSVDTEFVYPQYSVPPPLGNFTMIIEDLPEEYVSFEIPIVISLEEPQIIDVYPPKLTELQHYSFIVVAEGFFANSSYSNLSHSEGDSISVNVSTENLGDWWGCFVLPTSRVVDRLFAYSDTLGEEELFELYDYTKNYIEGSGLFLVVVRNEFYYDRLKLTYSLRGDVDHNGYINLSDVIRLANYILKGGPPPIPLQSADVNCDGAYTLVDVILLARYVLLGEPFPC